MKSPLPLHQRNARVSPCETLTPPPPSSHGRHRSPRSAKENVDPNPDVPSQLGKTSPSKLKPGLPPRPPNPLKRKLNLETLPENDVLPSLATDYGVQVIVRMRPLNNDEVEGDQIVQKISSDSVSILDHAFTFDSIADTKSTQQDIFNLVGVPLVENCLAGFNSSIFAYGQTGSGKTYTMWGPPSALSEDDSGSERGLTPRVFERLFFRINEVGSTVPSDKQLTYRCRCSFWEIYNEQITDLLNPVQKNLQIREDVKAGVYVDYLTEVFVCTTKDVTQLLIKGLANRRTSATAVNAESSRSHCVFTCVVESRSKSVPDGLSSIRTSRINLVDLAGSERQKLTGAAGERLREAGNINRSLSQLGNLINILAEVSQSGKQRHIPYRDSKLTFLLQESLGGNAKLAMICAISPSQSCKNETLSTLRFAQRAKAIKNKATINEIRQDDVNVLREQIRQLKDELLRMRSNGSSVESNGSYSTGWNARRSLSLLRMSLNCPTVVPATKDDNDVEMEIDENDVERSHIHANPKSSFHEELHVQPGSYKEEDKTVYYNKTISGIAHSIHRSQSDNGSNDGSSDSMKCRDLEEVAPSQVCSKNDAEICSSMDHSINKSLNNGTVVHVSNKNTLLMPKSNKVTDSKSLEEKVYVSHGSTLGTNFADMSSADPSNNASGCVSSIMSQVCLDNIPCQTSLDLNSPTLSVSPIAESQGGKDLRTSSAMPSSQNNKLTNSDLLVLSLSFAENSSSNPSKAPLIQKQKDCTAPNDRLAASLHHGLQIIDNLQHNSGPRMSAFRFSMRPTDLKPLMPVNKIDVGVQTLQESETEVSSSLCRFCKNKASESEHQDVENSKDLHLVTDDETLPTDNATKQLPKAVEKVLAGAIRREMALEYRCRKQDAEIVQLGRLVQQYKHERECNAIIVQTCEDKIARLERLMDDILPTEEFMDAEFMSLTNEHKILKGKYENHPEILRVNIELKRALDELDGYKNFFDLGERDVLMEEIQDLRTQLQYFTNSSLPTRKLSQVHRFTPANQLVANPVSTIAELVEESSEKKLEKERSHIGNDSKLISLIEGLRLELEASRCLAEKQKLELDTEKKCAEELKEALQIAMQGHARILEQYADLQEKNIELLRRHRNISDGIEDVKRAAVKSGIKGPESRYINSLAAEISALRVEREKERRYWTDENKGLRAQLRDTAEAVQAAGELLVRLKEAEEALALAQKRALVAEDETEKAYQEIDRLKENYDREIITLNKLVEEAHLPNDTRPPAPYGSEMEFDLGEDGEFSKGTDPSLWYSGNLRTPSDTDALYKQEGSD